jgi:hypothetical protein
MVQVVGKTEEWEVVKNYRPTLNDENFLVVNAVKPFNKCPVPENSLRVVVSEDEVDMSVKSSGLKAPIPLLNITEAEIPEMVNMVIRTDNGIPIVNESLVHLLYGIPRTGAIFQDVRMEKMMVTREPNLVNV